mgnify:CR=1 FL=1
MLRKLLPHAAIIISGIPGKARAARGPVLQLKGQEYLEAATAVNTPTWKIMLRHIVPNIMAPMIVTATLSISSTILQVSGLKVTYSVTAPPGERILLLTLADGTELSRNDEDTRFTVVSTAAVLDGEYDYPPFGNTIPAGTELSAAESYIRALGTVAVPEDSGRIEILGPRVLFAGFNARLIGAVIAVIGLMYIAVIQKQKRVHREA